MGVAGAVIGAGVIGAVGSVATGVMGANAAKGAANTQAQAASNAAAATMNMFNTNQANLAPYRDLGDAGLHALSDALFPGAQVPGDSHETVQTGGGSRQSLLAPFQPTMDQLSQTPGYQFTLQQGEQAVTNQMAASGLGGSSGPLGKGLINYAEGLASTTYQQQFQNYWAQNQQIYNMLGGTVNTGANAAGGTASLGAAAVGSANNALLGGAAASAAGTVGSANALGAGISGVGSSVSNAGLLYSLNNAGMFGKTGGGGFQDNTSTLAG